MEMLVKVKVATGMKKLFSIGLILFLLAGCGTSAEQKRNNYDVCIFEKTREYWGEIKEPINTTRLQDFYRPQVEGAAKSFCIKLLE